MAAAILFSLILLAAFGLFGACFWHYRQKIYQQERSHCIAAKVFETTGEAILITDINHNIVEINPAFTHITGYQREEIVGKNPRLLKSGRHGPDFYRGIWQTLNKKGQWQGEIWDRRKNGEIYPKWLSLSVVCDEKDKITHYVAIFSDISSVKRSEENLWRITHYDFLTGLPNRLLFRDRLKQAILHGERYQQLVALLFLDLDGFKYINDSLGHSVGDQLLVEVTRRLNQNLRKTDTVSRLGGDEFTVIVSEAVSLEAVANVAEKLLTIIAEPFYLCGQYIHLTTSMGIAIYPTDGRDVDMLLKNADIAMYHAKEKSKNCFSFFADEMNSRAMNRLQLESKLRQAIDNEELCLYFQPRLDLLTGQITSAEVLLRWHHQELGWISPAEFIPLAEERGLIIPLGFWVLRKTIEKIKTWQTCLSHSVRLAVNLSAKQFHQPDLVTHIANLLSEYAVSSSLLEVELTETSIMRETEKGDKLREIKNLGIHIAIDDFGTGYSSLNYLKRFPIDSLKIDRSFVHDIPQDRDSIAICKAIIAMAHSMNLAVVAEGVETQAQLDFFRQQHCNEVQGFYLYPPLPEDEFLIVLHNVQSSIADYLDIGAPDS